MGNTASEKRNDELWNFRNIYNVELGRRDSYYDTVGKTLKEVGDFEKYKEKGEKEGKIKLIISGIIILALYIVYIIYTFAGVGWVTALFNIALILGLVYVLRTYAFESRNSFIATTVLTIALVPLSVNELFGTVGIVDKIFAVSIPALIGLIIYNEISVRKQ